MFVEKFFPEIICINQVQFILKLQGKNKTEAVNGHLKFNCQLKNVSIGIICNCTRSAWNQQVYLNQKSLNPAQKSTINAEPSRKSSKLLHLNVISGRPKTFESNPKTFHWDLNSLKEVMALNEASHAKSMQKKKNLHFNGFLMSCVFCLNSQLGDVSFWGPMGVIIKRSIYSFKLASNIAHMRGGRRKSSEKIMNSLGWILGLKTQNIYRERKKIN